MSRNSPSSTRKCLPAKEMKFGMPDPSFTKGKIRLKVVQMEHAHDGACPHIGLDQNATGNNQGFHVYPRIS